jgi:hypothetical protein
MVPGDFLNRAMRICMPNLAFPVDRAPKVLGGDIQCGDGGSQTSRATSFELVLHVNEGEAGQPVFSRRI